MKIIRVFPRRTKMTPEDGRVGLWARMFEAWQAGFFPFGMLYQGEYGQTQPGWKAKPFADVHCIAKKLKQMENGLL